MHGSFAQFFSGIDWGSVIKFGAVFAWEHWLSQTSLFNAGSTVGLFKNAVTGKPL